MADDPPLLTQPSETDAALNNILEKYPALRGHDWSVVDSRGKTSAVPGGQLEFYSPDEPDSPTPGRPTVEVFNPKLRGEELENAIFGDMLHHMPSDDPNFAALREKFHGSLTDDQHQMNQRAYERDKQGYGEDRPYDQWMQQSRLDAFIRGKLAHQWPDDTFTPEQHGILGEIDKYLRSEPVRQAPLMQQVR